MIAARSKALAYIGLGSNLGDRQAALARAREALAALPLDIVAHSSLYLTEPVEVTDQEEFVNQVVACETELGPPLLLRACLAVERAMGRVRTVDKGPRSIDLDLLLHGDTILRTGEIVVPHPRMHLRRFVLVPLVEIAPGARHPVLGATAAEMLLRCPDRARVRRLTEVDPPD